MNESDRQRQRETEREREDKIGDMFKSFYWFLKGTQACKC